MNRRTLGNDRGFTLVEILIAIVLVGVLSAVVVVGVGNLTSKGSTAACTASLDAARASTVVHLTGAGTAATTFTDLVASGSLSLPSGVTVGAGGRRLVGTDWQLVLATAPNGSMVFTCGTGTTALPLDTTTASPAAAFSLRRLSAVYTGPAVRIRRSNDNAETDIGFTATDALDTAAIAAFVGANSAYVTTWYDQSGNGRHASNATAAEQPRLVNAGVIGSALEFRPESTGSVLRIGTLTTSFALGSLVWTGASTRTTTWAAYDTIVGHVHTDGSPSSGIAIHGGASNNTILFRTGFTSIQMRLNGGAPAGALEFAPMSTPKVISATMTPTAPTTWRIGMLTSVDQWAGPMRELILYSTSLSTADRQTVERSQGAAYGITVA